MAAMLEKVLTPPEPFAHVQVVAHATVVPLYEVTCEH